MNARYFQALALLVGTIIGVGMFALPYVIAQTGFLLGVLELVFLTGVILAIHLMYGDIVLSRPELHQLPGYVSHYLGRSWRAVASASSSAGLLGAMVVYVILGTKFLGALMAPWLGDFTYHAAVILFLVTGLSVFFYNSWISTEINGVFSAMLIFFMVVLITLGILFGNFGFIAKIDVSRAAIPYGVILFALAGTSVIPRVRETLASDGRYLRSVILWGTLAPAVLYSLFTAAILASSGGGVSQDAISGIAEKLGEPAAILGNLIGFLAIITSFIGVGLTFKELLNIDFGVKKNLAWVITSFLPFILVAMGISDFIRVISFVGALTIGTEGVLIVSMWKSLSVHCVLGRFPALAAYGMVAMFMLGVIYEITRTCAGIARCF
ncbi:MAG: hypothetical protein HYT39_01455 [Candidatus Sungbacteria bacterium]|nr:hypothetical protein [Candidatus Sungbacteria bacterium]